MSSQIKTPEDNNLCPGDIIVTKCHTYEVQSLLGEGSFGKVVKCVRTKDNKTVAVKVLKKEGRYHDQAKAEIDALLKFKDLDLDKCSLVQNYSVFMHKGFYCLVFEHLEQTLSAFMIARSYQPLPLKSIKLIVQQLATALQTLRIIGLTHTDIKLDNVMLVNHRLQPFKVKLIDFGLAKNASAIPKGAIIQPLFCRSPEVFLGLPLTDAIDMWSLGCLGAKLYLGVRLYYGTNEYEMMKSIVTTQGQPPTTMLRAGLRTHLFFKRCPDTSWKLKTPGEYSREVGQRLKGTKRMTLVLKSLDDICHVSSVKEEERTEQIFFVDMLKKMLHLNPVRRIKPSHLLLHQFLTGFHPRYTRVTPVHQATTSDANCLETELKTFSPDPRPLNQTRKENMNTTT